MSLKTPPAFEVVCRIMEVVRAGSTPHGNPFYRVTVELRGTRALMQFTTQRDGQVGYYIDDRDLREGLVRLLVERNNIVSARRIEDVTDPLSIAW